jgi:bacteriorhodopsin
MSKSDIIWTIVGCIGLALTVLFFMLPPDKPKRPGC